MKDCFNLHFRFVDRLPLTPGTDVATQIELERVAPRFLEFGPILIHSLQMFHNVPLACAAPQFGEDVCAAMSPTIIRNNDGDSQPAMFLLLNPDYMPVHDATMITEPEILVSHAFLTAPVARPSMVNLWGTDLDGKDFMDEIPLSAPGVRYMLQAIDIARGVSVETKMSKLSRDQLRRQLHRAMRNRRDMRLFDDSDFDFHCVD